jgi:polyisoprenoid-binding protein YceI
METVTVCGLLLLALAPLATAQAQERNPFSTPRAESRPASPAAAGPIDSAAVRGVADSTALAQFKGVDSVVYRLVPASRLQVKTGKAGLFGFAGHSHLIQARAFRGTVVYRPHAPASSHLEITVAADSLQVLTPPDTAEIRKVTATMRTEVLHTGQYPEIRLVSRQVTPTRGGFQIQAALTLVGQTREIPLTVTVHAGLDTLKARTSFSLKQSDFGIKPYSGGPAGTVKVADRVTFDINAIAVRLKPAANQATR